MTVHCPSYCDDVTLCLPSFMAYCKCRLRIKRVVAFMVLEEKDACSRTVTLNEMLTRDSSY